MLQSMGLQSHIQLSNWKTTTTTSHITLPFSDTSSRYFLFLLKYMMSCHLPNWTLTNTLINREDKVELSRMREHTLPPGNGAPGHKPQRWTPMFTLCSLVKGNTRKHQSIKASLEKGRISSGMLKLFKWKTCVLQQRVTYKRSEVSDRKHMQATLSTWNPKV